MSFSAKVSNPYAQNPNDAQRYSTWKEADPCPIGYGCNKTGLKWMTDQFDIQKPQANKYSSYLVSSIVGLIGICQLTRLGYIWINGRAVCPLNDNWNASGYADTSIATWLDGNPGFNSFVRVYRGLETQPADTDLINASGQQHTRYPGSAYAILYHVNWGAGASSIQNVEIEWIAVPPALNGWTSGNNNLYGTNLIASTAGLMSHRRGGAALGAYIDPVSWGSQAQALETNGVGGRTGQLTWGHPCYTQQKDVQTVLADLASYYDGYFPITGTNLGVSWRPGAAPDATGLTVLSEQDHVEPPQGQWAGRQALPNMVVVTCTEEGTYATRAMTGPVARNIAAAPGNQTPKKFDLPFFKSPSDGTSTNVPQIVATRLGQDASALDSTGTSKVFRRSAVWASGTPLAPGDLFVLNFSKYSLNRIVRIKSIADDAANEYVEITWIRERGAFPTVYAPVADVRVVPTDVAPAGISAGDIQPFFLPSGFGLTRQVALLVQRPSFAYSSATIWYASASAGPYASLGSQNYWAVHATLTAGIGSGDASIAITTTGVDMPAIQSEASLPQADDTLLAVIPSTGEVLSIGSVTVTTTNNYTLAVLRGRQGSAATAASNGASVWLVPRSLIVGWANAQWANVFSGGVYNSTTATKYFEVQPASATKTGTAGPSGGVGYVLPNIVPSAPTGLVATAPGGAAISLTWTQVSSAYLDKYQVQRSTVGSTGPWTTIGYTKANKFDDTGTVGGLSVPQQCWYEVIALDIWGNASGASSVATATTGGAPKDPTPPQAAGAITFNSNGAVSVAGDGTVTSAILLNVPAITGAATGYLAASYQNLLYRVQGSTGWQIGVAELRNTGSATQTVDLLAPGIPYEFALQEFTADHVPGAITMASGLPYTSPMRTAAPSAPGGLAVDSTGQHVNSKMTTGSGKSAVVAAEVTWNQPTDLDVIKVEWLRCIVLTGGGGPGLATTFLGVSQTGFLTKNQDWLVCYALNSDQKGWIAVRFWNSSNVVSAWSIIDVRTGVFQAYIGSLGGQENNAVSVTGVQIGGSGLSGSASTTNTDGWNTGIYTAAGGSPREKFYVSLPGGFSSKPTGGTVVRNSDWSGGGVKVDFWYDYDDASNSSTQAAVYVESHDGVTNLPNWSYRYKYQFKA